MNSIQKYVLNSLFVRNQITEEKLAQALDTFSNESAINAFLSVLIADKDETKRELYLIANWERANRLLLLKSVKDAFNIGLESAKDIVDENTVNYTFECPLRTITGTEVSDYDQERIIELFNKNNIDLKFK